MPSSFRHFSCSGNNRTVSSAHPGSDLVTMSRLLRFTLALTLLALGNISVAEDPGLRNLILTGSADDLGMELPAAPWAVVMETGIDGGSYTLVAIYDGTASIYFSNGGGIIGAGEHAEVAAVSTLLVSDAKDYAAHFSKVDSPADRPLPGNTVFYIRSGESLLKFEAEEATLGDGNHALSNFFYRAHDLITAIRTATPEDGD